jgi:hypothetical protein
VVAGSDLFIDQPSLNITSKAKSLFLNCQPNRETYVTLYLKRISIQRVADLQVPVRLFQDSN